MRNLSVLLCSLLLACEQAPSSAPSAPSAAPAAPGASAPAAAPALAGVTRLVYERPTPDHAWQVVTTLTDAAALAAVAQAIGAGPTSDALRRCPDTSRLVGYAGADDVRVRLGFCGDAGDPFAGAEVELAGQGRRGLTVADAAALAALLTPRP
jgi:hypothetical protein